MREEKKGRGETWGWLNREGRSQRRGEQVRRKKWKVEWVGVNKAEEMRI